MPISDDNTKVLVIMPKGLKKDLQNLATDEDRSLSNLIVIACKDLLKKYETK